MPGLPQLAVLHAQRVAEELDDPAALGLAAWLRALVLGGAGRERVLDLCGRTIDGLDGALGDPNTAQMVGALHLCSALANAALQRGDDATAHLGEAQRLAELQPENAPDFGLVYFTPDNVGIWRVSIAVELGEFGRAREAARGVVLDHVPSAARQAVYWSDLGRGMAADRSSMPDAVRALRRAEDISPHTIRNNVFVRETVTHLLRAPVVMRLAASCAGLSLCRHRDGDHSIAAEGPSPGRAGGRSPARGPPADIARRSPSVVAG